MTTHAQRTPPPGKTSTEAAARRQAAVVIEAGIAKFPAGRLEDQARAAAEAAYARRPEDRVYRIPAGTPLEEVNALELAPGATVLFERGGTWRGQLQVASGIPGRPIRYGAFGDGAPPAIQPSMDGGDPDSWREEASGVWAFDTGSPIDVGNAILDDGASGCLFKRGARADLLHDRDFFFDPGSGRVFVRSDGGNPARRWRSVELAQKLNGVDQPCAHDVEYSGLCVRYAAAHGFGGGGTARIVLRDCSVLWIGGGYLYRDDLGNGVRYGNGIELWGGAQDVLVERCRASECWDAGITNQTNEPGSVQRNVVWRNCEVSRCEYSYEFWHQGEGGTAENVRLENNRFSGAGLGWGHAQRWNPNAAHLMLYDTVMHTPGFVVSGNVFSRSENVLMRVFNDWKGEAAFEGNVWESAGEPLARCHRRPRLGLRHFYPDRLDRIHDDNALEIESQGPGGTLYGASADSFGRLCADFAFGAGNVLKTVQGDFSGIRAQ